MIKRSSFPNSRLILRISRVKQNFSFPVTFNYPLASCIAFDWEKRKKEIFRVIQKQCAPRDIKKEETFRFELVELVAFFSCFQFRSRPPGRTKEILRSLPSFDSRLGFAPHFPWIPNLSTKRNVVPQPFDAFQISQTKTSQTFFKPAINSGLDSSSFSLFLSSRNWIFLPIIKLTYAIILQTWIFLLEEVTWFFKPERKRDKEKNETSFRFNFHRNSRTTISSSTKKENKDFFSDGNLRSNRSPISLETGHEFFKGNGERLVHRTSTR